MQAAPLNEFRLNWVVEVIEAGTLVVWSDFCLISGETLSVQGSRFDFSEEKSLSTLVDSDGHIDIDNDLVLRSNTSIVSPSRFYSPRSGIRMDVTTSYPVIHLYGGRHLMCTGKGGETYASGKGLAIEAQFHTGSLNYVSFSNNTFLQNRTKPLGPHTSREFADKTFALLR
ncbi:unnamed protein product [Heligmosomoides polygyrus]|uniref:G8 domain-containing protein n=1 Tax=Heligmosomoides polygyrus TaxID=6339 RepID=A0A183FTF6_HELPZ|nr:unnamed protein product [Heligmosomoides polygyrus]